MKTIGKFILMISSLLLLGCVNAYYVPNTVNVPLLTDQHDARVSAHYYTTTRDYFNSIPGFELQGSYAATSHLGVMGSFLWADKTKEAARFSARYGDLGIGYFGATRNRHWVIECYGGFGMGSTTNTFENGATGSGDFTKIFVQPVFGFRSRYFDAGFAWRFASVNHTSLSISAPLPDGPQLDYDWIVSNPTYYVHEPALVMRLGADPVKVQLHYGYSQPNDHTDPRFVFSVALTVLLPWRIAVEQAAD